ncbi:MAG: DUF3368 domain-containing protein [Crocosphaera sp.]|nr:DUF3368 domain-containing protein [Crocosphaera sp.]
MNEIIIADTACLIALERIGQLDILPSLFDSIIIPPKVAKEFGISYPWLNIETINNQGTVLALKMLVDDGEAEAIALAYERQLKVILDDQQARKIARKMGVKMIGTVGILIKAKQNNIIPKILPLLNNLEANGFYLSTKLKNEALRIAQESQEQSR